MLEFIAIVALSVIMSIIVIFITFYNTKENIKMSDKILTPIVMMPLALLLCLVISANCSQYELIETNYTIKNIDNISNGIVITFDNESIYFDNIKTVISNENKLVKMEKIYSKFESSSFINKFTLTPDDTIDYVLYIKAK